MKLREAQVSDYSKLAAIESEANLDDGMDKYCYPYRYQHLESHRKVYFKEIQDLARNPLCTIVVAVDDQDEPLGYAAWERWTEDDKVRSLLDKRTRAQKYLDVCKSRLSVPGICNPACSIRGSVRRLRIALYHVRHRTESPEPPEHWFVNLIAVSPNHQRRGIGRMLMKWGMDQATKDRLPIWLYATPTGVPLYHKLGMQEHGVWQCAPASTEQERKERSLIIFKWDSPGHNDQKLDELGRL